jgi:hypothetical protein
MYTKVETHMAKAFPVGLSSFILESLGGLPLREEDIVLKYMDPESTRPCRRPPLPFPFVAGMAIHYL